MPKFLLSINFDSVEDGRYFWSDGTEEKLDGSMYKNFAPGNFCSFDELKCERRRVFVIA